MTESTDFLGAGLAFPLRVDERGQIALSRRDANIDEAIGIILSTRVGERRMRPRFGCGVHDLTFSTNDPATLGLIRYHALQALSLWEPRILVRDQDIQVRADRDMPERILVEIHYKVRATNQSRNLVYPFYLIPGEA